MYPVRLLAVCLGQTWRWQLGDTDLVGLVLTAGYVLVLVLLIRAVFAPPDRFAGPRDRQLWMLVLAGFLLLAINKQLDLQHIAIDAGRCYSVAQGWYDERAGFQREIAWAILTFAGLVALALAYAFRKALAANLRLILGLALLVSYVLLQVADFLHLAGYSRGIVNFTPLHHLIEAFALLTLSWAAWSKARPS